MSDPSPLRSTVSLNQSGKSYGHLLIPQSTNSAGWANELLPLAVIQGTPGPTALLIGGNHGDEYEGQVTLMKLARSLDPQQLSGRLIILPMLNLPACRTGTRLSPLDGMNMNRAFPGDPRGTITSMIAHYVATELIPLADLVIDIHSGGSSLHMLPSVNMHELEPGDQMDQMLAAGKAWAAPYVFIYKDVAGSGLLPGYAESLGKVTLGTEMGSKAQYGPDTLKTTLLGVQRVLNFTGMLDLDESTTATGEPSQVVAANDVRDYVLAPRSGIYEPFCELADSVSAGQPIGCLYDPEAPFAEPMIVTAQTDGMLFARRSIPLTKQGECVATIVRPVNR